MFYERLSRRHRYSMSLPLTVRLRQWWGVASRPVRKSLVVEDTVTENIGSSGCYFLLSQRPLLGAKVEMDITFPAQPSGSQETRLRCWGRVIRVETGIFGGRIGVASSIDHFQFLSATEPIHPHADHMVG